MHKKLILHTVDLYLTQGLKGNVYQRAVVQNIASKIAGYNIFHKFTQDEHKTLISIGKEPYMQRLKEVQIDWTVYALELLVLLLKDGNKIVNLNNKKVYEYKSKMVMDMIGLKHDDAEKHSATKEIVMQSRLVAKQYYEYTKDGLSAN